MTRASSIALVAAVAACAACGGKLPETRYYQLAAPGGDLAPGEGRAPAGGRAPAADLVLAIEPLTADDAYQDERIVYRTSPYRIDYYQYHRWSAAPGVMIAGYLEQALERSGRFRAVVRELTDDATAVLGGRVIAIEEVDQSRTRWLGRIAVELTLRDAQTGEVLWSRELAETEPLTTQSPEGLAQALSTAMARIAARAIPEIGRLAAARAALHRRNRPTATLWRAAASKSE